MSAQRLNFNGDPYMPINLKGVLLRYGLKQPDWARAVTQKNGSPLSVAAASLLINWGTWPRNTPAESIRNQTESWLLENGVPKSDLSGIWDTDTGDKYRQGQPNGVHIGQASPKPTRRLKVVHPIEPDPVGVIEMLNREAKEFFRLFRDPFQNDINSQEDIFMSAEQRYIRETLWLEARNHGFVAIVGESGAGKTVLATDLKTRAKEEGDMNIIEPFIIGMEADERKGHVMKARELEQAIIMALDPYCVIKQDAQKRTKQMEEMLKASAEAKNHNVLLIEEAHSIPNTTLRHLKRLREIKDGFSPLLSIILIGQPELLSRLDESRNPTAREVIRRIQIAELLPLNNYLEEYLAFKFKRIGRDSTDIFEADAYDAIRMRLKNRGSYPLIVNNLVTKAINMAAGIRVKVSAEVINKL